MPTNPLDYWIPVLLPRLLLLLFSAIILSRIVVARRRRLFIRRIPGLTAVDEAVGRATEMGRPITFSLGLGDLNIITLQALAIAIHVTRMAIRFGNRVILTMADATVYAVADEATREAYTAEGRPESYRVEDVRFLSDRQFAYASSVVGVINRERVASNFMFGTFFAESLVLAEAGNQVGAIQVAGTPSTTQIPFFIAACDYTIIGDEYYAGTAYLTREPVLLGSLVGQDYCKIILLATVTFGLLFASVWHAATGQPVQADLAHVRSAPTKMASFPFTKADLKNAAGLVVKLRTSPDPVSQYVTSKLSPATRSLLEAYPPPPAPPSGASSGAPPGPGGPSPAPGGAPAPSGPPAEPPPVSPELQQALVEELNRLREDPGLYSEQRFPTDALSPDTKELLAQHPQGADLYRLNRLLLTDTYGGELNRAPLSLPQQIEKWIKDGAK